MTSIRFNSSVLDPVPSAEPGHQPLRRRASAPELADWRSIHENTPQLYEARNIIRISINNQVIQAKVVKTFTPFTSCQAMVVQIFAPSLDLEGTYVLKVYDRRHSDEVRETYFHKKEWTVAGDIEYERRRWSKDFVRFFLHLMSDNDLHFRGEDFWSDEEDSDENEKENESENCNQLETWAFEELDAQVTCLKMYRAELEVYRRARQHGIDGTDVPRFIGSVRLLPGYCSKLCRTQSSNIKGVPGILMQYLPGCSLRDIYNTPSPRPAREHWQSIIDDGLRIVQYYIQNMEFRNGDPNFPRNSVVHWDPIGKKWKCKLIDFGNCYFRSKDMTDWDWRHLQFQSDEEEYIARHMELFLERRKDFQYTWKRSEYTEELYRDFEVDPDEFDVDPEPKAGSR